MVLATSSVRAGWIFEEPGYGKNMTLKGWRYGIDESLLSRTMPRIAMVFDNETGVPAILIVVIGGSDLIRWVVLSEIASVLSGFRAKPLWQNQIYKSESHSSSREIALMITAGDGHTTDVFSILLLHEAIGGQWKKDRTEDGILGYTNTAGCNGWLCRMNTDKLTVTSRNSRPMLLIWQSFWGVPEM